MAIRTPEMANRRILEYTGGRGTTFRLDVDGWTYIVQRGINGAFIVDGGATITDWGRTEKVGTKQGAFRLFHNEMPIFLLKAIAMIATWDRCCACEGIIVKSDLYCGRCGARQEPE